MCHATNRNRRKPGVIVTLAMCAPLAREKTPGHVFGHGSCPGSRKAMYVKTLLSIVLICDYKEEKQKKLQNKKNMTVIFLDIDYVLNNSETKEHIGHITGVDPDLLELLKKIVDILDAKIVLSSTWRTYWTPDLKNDGVNNWRGSSPFRFGRYLNIKFAEHGLEILDKTPDIAWWKRAEEILNWLKDHPEVDRFVILDDEDFRWKKYGLEKHWICTYRCGLIGYDGGLTTENVRYIKENKNQFLRTNNI